MTRILQRVRQHQFKFHSHISHPKMRHLLHFTGRVQSNCLSEPADVTTATGSSMSSGFIVTSHCAAIRSTATFGSLRVMKTLGRLNGFSLKKN